MSGPALFAERNKPSGSPGSRDNIWPAPSNLFPAYSLGVFLPRNFQWKILACAFILLAPVCPGSVRAQSADKILKDYVKAVGGEKKLKAIKNLTAVGEVRDTANGQTGSFMLETRTPDSFYLEMTGEGLAWSEGFNGNSGWEQKAGGSPSTLTGWRSAQLRATAFYWSDHFQNLSKIGAQAALAGQEMIDRNTLNALEITTRAGVHRKFLFDAKSGVLVKEIEEGDGAEEETLFSDYRPVDGVLEPFHLVIQMSGRTFEVTMREARHNVQMDGRIFAFPEETSAPLPDPTELFREVDKNQKQLDLLRKNYTYTADESELVTDDKGKTREKEARRYEVFYLGSEEVDRLVAKQGKPLTDEEKKKEDERIDKIYKKYEEKKKKEANGAETPKKDEEDGDVEIKDFLRASEFVNARRERFDGQEMIVFDFQPRPDFKPHNLNERLVQTLSGVIWIDENAKEVVRLEARTNDNFKIGGGLAVSLQKGMYLAFEQEYVHDEVWLPSYAEIHLSARALLFVHFKGDVIDRFTNYKKFGSDIQIRHAGPEKQ